MRIVAGELGGRKLTSMGTGDVAAHLRPTSDRLRESLFNMLASGRFDDPFDGAVVLDLFAGTGALGFEALSRGAARLVLVDSGAKSARLIWANIKLLGVEARCHLIRREVGRIGPNTHAPATLVFLDPPYGKSLGGPALKAAMKGGWIAPGALIVWEENAAQEPPEGFDLLETKQQGDSCLTLARAQG